MDASYSMAEYLSHDGRLAKWAKDFIERKKKIEAFPKVCCCLAELQNAGADPQTLLSLLTMIFPGAVPKTKKQFKALRERLTSLANRLESLAKEVEAVTSDPLNHSGFYRTLLLEQNKDFSATEKTIGGARYLCNSFKVFVNYFRAEAKAFQELASTYKDARMSEGIVPVLKYVKQSTGEFHDECVANLLQAAHDAFNVKATFSGPILRKLRQRKSPEMVRKRRAPSYLEHFRNYCRPLMQ
jgi:hypothetical protein